MTNFAHQSSHKERCAEIEPVIVSRSTSTRQHSSHDRATGCTARNDTSVPHKGFHRGIANCAGVVRPLAGTRIEKHELAYEVRAERPYRVTEASAFLCPLLLMSSACSSVSRHTDAWSNVATWTPRAVVVSFIAAALLGS